MSGRGLVLMSGGIDSPVAAYRMMRRGLRCVFLHFSGMPLTGPESIYKAYAWSAGSTGSRAARGCTWWRSARRSRRLATSGAGRLQVVAQRRLMLKTARGARPAGWTPPRWSPGTPSARCQPDADQHHRARRRCHAADPAPAARLGQDRDHGRGAPVGTLALSELPDQDCCRCSSRAGWKPGRGSTTCADRGRLDAEEIAEQLATPPRSTGQARAQAPGRAGRAAGGGGGGGGGGG